MQKVIDIALGEVGYLEKASNFQLDSQTGNAGENNYTKYWAELAPNMQGQPWCQAYISYCFQKAYGKDMAKKMLCADPSKSWTFYTPTAASYFKTSNLWFSTPQKGDIIYFKNSSRICHVGLVVEVKNGIVYTVEGNTSSKDGMVPNGGAVARKSYKTTYSRIAGYGRPKYFLAQSSTYTFTHKVTGCSKLNVRQGAGTNYQVVTVLSAGDQVEILETANGWHKIQCSDGTVGYCSAKYIS